MIRTTEILCKKVSKIVLHFAWPFLEPPSIARLYVATPVTSKLCSEAIYLTATEIHRIHTSLDHRISTSSICSLRTRNFTKILLLYNFLPGGMICCPGGVNISAFLDFASIHAYLLALSNISVNPGEPPHDLPALQNLFHQHIPSKLHSEALEETCYSGTATIIIVPPAPTSPLLTRSWPPTSKILLHCASLMDTMFCQRGFSYGPTLRHTHTQGQGQRDIGQ